MALLDSELLVITLRAPGYAYDCSASVALGDGRLGRIGIAADACHRGHPRPPRQARTGLGILDYSRRHGGGGARPTRRLLEHFLEASAWVCASSVYSRQSRKLPRTWVEEQRARPKLRMESRQRSRRISVCRCCLETLRKLSTNCLWRAFAESQVEAHRGAEG